MKKLYLINILFSLIFTFAAAAYAEGPMPMSGNSANITSQMSTCDFKIANRKLWSDHVTWTRMYIISDLANLNDTKFAADRLLRNQKEIGNSIKPFYGEEAGNKLADLLTQHIMLAVELVKYAKAGNAQQLALEEKKWYANADAIASFLSSASPNLPKKAVTDMLYDHLQVTKQEVVYRLNKNYTSDIEAYDTILDHILKMSDAISEAMIKQFPDRFCK